MATDSKGELVVNVLSEVPKLIVHYFPMSQPSRSIKLLCDEAGIDHEAHIVNIMKGEQKAAEYLTINPCGQVPAISEGDFTLSEGGAILEYLASSRGLTSWLGGDAKTQAKVAQWMHWHHSNTRNSTTGIVRPALTGSKDDAGAQAFGAAAAALEEHFSSAGPFVAGTETPTIADLLLLPEIDQLIVFGLFDFTPYPKLTAWAAAVKKSLPRSYPKSVAPLEEMAKSMKK